MSQKSQKVNLVKEAVVNVRLVCEEALGKNVNSIKQKLDEVQMSNKSLRAQIRGTVCKHHFEQQLTDLELQEHNEMMMLDQPSTLFNIGDFS